MKLLYIHQYFVFPELSGGTRSYDLSQSFTKKGIDVTMITTNAGIKDLEFPKNKRWVYLEEGGIKFWILKCPYNQKMSIKRRILSFVQFMYYSSIKSIQIKSDILIATSTPLTIGIPALVKKLFSKTPYIFEVRDVWPEGPIELGFVKNNLFIKFLLWFEKLVYKQSNYIVALSEGMKESIVSRLGNINKIKVIPNISEINRFSKITDKLTININLENKKIVLYAGSIGFVNELTYIGNLAKMLTDSGEKDIIFLIVGDGKKKEETIKYCKENGTLNTNVFFLGKVPKNTLPYLYSISTIGSSFFLNNKVMWANSANKFFDTLAAGKPILINYKGWQKELIEKENCGYVLSPILTTEDVRKFADYIHNQSLITEQGENAKKIGANYFSLEVASEKYYKVIKESLQH